MAQDEFLREVQYSDFSEVLSAAADKFSKIFGTIHEKVSILPQKKSEAPVYY